MENFEIGKRIRNQNPSQDKDQKQGRDQAQEKKQSQNQKKDEGTLNMSVSPICQKDGKKIAYVSFTDPNGEREAEGEIPACRIIHSRGFREEEVEQLESYLKRELSSLKSMAAKINVFDAFLGRTKS